MFPLSVTGTIHLKRDSFDERRTLLKEIGARLASCKPSGLTVGEDAVSFQGGLLRPVLSTNLLVPITRGSVEVLERPTEILVSYKLFFSEVAIAATFLAFFLAQAPVEWIPKPLMFVGFWVLLGGGNYLISALRFRAMLRRACRNVAVHGSSAESASSDLARR
jgi:hypothetical protein